MKAIDRLNAWIAQVPQGLLGASFDAAMNYRDALMMHANAAEDMEINRIIPILLPRLLTS